MPGKNRCLATNKRKFKDEISAQLDLLRIQRKKGHKRDKEPVRVFKCGYCKGYHLTSWESHPQYESH